MTRNSSLVHPYVCQVVQSVWNDAGYASPSIGIVPLYELIANYPIWVAEVENLSFERAFSYLAERTGQAPELGLEGSGPLSGFLYAYQYHQVFLGCILLEKHDPIVRRRFSVAHELGHYKLHFLPKQDQLIPSQLVEGLQITDALIYAEQKEGSEDLTMPVGLGEVIQQSMLIIDDEKETEANQFAANLLMPENILQERIAALRLPSNKTPRGYLVSRLASEFLVSREAMSFRLITLGI